MDKPIFLKGGNLIDGNGGEVLENAGVFIEGERISQVGPVNELKIPDDAEVIDTSGYTIMPGLIDAHMHLFGVTSLNLAIAFLEPNEIQLGRALTDLPKLINAGFTSVRDVGSPISIYIKQLIQEGLYHGPRIKTAYNMLTQTAGHGDLHMLPPELNKNRVCDGVDDCRKAAREQFRAGADFIKICSTGGVLSEKDDPRFSQFTIDEIRAIVYEAEAVGSFVASHAQGTQGIKNALIAGVKTIEHGIFIDDEGIELMLERDAILVPTLSIVHRLITEGEKHGVPEFGLRKSKEIYEIHKINMRKAYEAGVQMVIGTDFVGCSPVPHGENALELELFVNDLGFSPMEAIVAATKTAAKAMAMEDEIGTIEAGKYADILVVAGNPAENIKVLLDTNNIKKVFVGGKLLKDI
ncbi:metal-dependent hydrolase family protein [Thermoflavimicrobium dichotomicum]|uniref:Imidazolonepropionase n=1 Tax=Thermoflavimicrobium dichotomicum TaxID=46223 RepID=A0A1I3VFC9_9BACL|nr:amidohydrolase family protein [Thermoflavimicrobium dichotomicum]SFJ93892.1 Imidazolonepropionase [Thermoflavimicrobium dichotomicum]